MMKGALRMTFLGIFENHNSAMKKTLFAAFVCSASLIVACKTQKGAGGSNSNSSTGTIVPFLNPYSANDYHPTATRVIDILHTALEVEIDWAKRYMYGKATIDARPYFYPTAVAELDARGMEIKNLRMVSGTRKDTIRPTYSYEQDVIKVQLGKTFSRNETFTFIIDYVAKPNELKKGGSAAISDDRGLYLINPDNTDPNVPKQFWTQGETQASSAWFPTIDRPNERMTSEITMKVDAGMVTLSNGILISSVVDPDGFKTDHWRMDLPHAPYLVMMAGGNFKVVKDQWRGKEVSYYVEPEFEKDARAIFGNTPEMMEFFSKKLGVDYPWAKYSQICAREYVSGAMENTTATLHSDFLQMDKREMIDGSYEDYISHELFHQWFGDYVTSESWSNLPLNESFATYGEYLWREYKYGKPYADQSHYQSRQGYWFESGMYFKSSDFPGKQEPLIRFNYDSQEDMFDAHSYNKGGQVLHMLRQEVGDDAFFASLKLYLETNKFQSAEIADLRLAFEKTTGRDLNWFFDQWFMHGGHPVLDISYQWNEKMKEQVVIIKQTQDFAKGIPVFRLPFEVDVYVNGKAKRESIVCDSKCDTFRFDCSQKPDLVNVDVQKRTLAWKTDRHTDEEWAFQYHHATCYMDKIEAIDGFTYRRQPSAIGKKVIAEAINDVDWAIREGAIYRSVMIADSIAPSLQKLIKSDSSSSVRTAALYILAEAKDTTLAIASAREALKDSSFSVFGAALEVLADYSPKEMLELGKKYEGENHRQIKLALARAYSICGGNEQQEWFEKTLNSMYGGYAQQFLYSYSQFIMRCDGERAEKSLDGIVAFANRSCSAGTKNSCDRMMMRLSGAYIGRVTELTDKIEKLGGEKKSNPRIDALKQDRAEALRMSDVADAKRKKIVK
jgi:aminopeptidase N